MLHHEVGVGSGRGKVLVVAHGTTLGHDIYVRDVIDDDDRVRDTGVDAVHLGQLATELDFCIELEVEWFAQLDADILGLEGRFDDPGDGFEADLLRVSSLEAIRVAAEAARAVAAHLGLATVGIVVAHAVVGSLF